MGREELERHRRERDRIFREGLTSPLTEEQKAGFDGLRYYDDDPALDLVVKVRRVPACECIVVETTKHETREFERYGEFDFVVEGRPLRLTLYRAPFGFFLPFVDASAGVETYGAGRYLDPLPLGEEEPEALEREFRIDFNLAYHPLCAYNDLWSCPITPPENHLPVAIRAGERLPEGKWVGHR